VAWMRFIVWGDANANSSKNGMFLWRAGRYLNICVRAHDRRDSSDIFYFVAIAVKDTLFTPLLLSSTPLSKKDTFD
jgi:hypothetical protein